MDEAQYDMRWEVPGDLEFRQAAEARSTVIYAKGGCDLEPGVQGRSDINEEGS